MFGISKSDKKIAHNKKVERRGREFSRRHVQRKLARVRVEWVIQVRMGKGEQFPKIKQKTKDAR